MNIRSTVSELLTHLHPDLDLTATTLIDDGILDSMDIVSLVSDIRRTLDIRIPAADILPDHFNSVDALVALLERLDDI